MGAERLSMRKIREVLRLRLGHGVGLLEIARSCGIGETTAGDYVRRFRAAGLSWPLPPELDDDRELTRVLFRQQHETQRGRPQPDWRWVHRELRRPHVTRVLLWQEFLAQEPQGIGYTQFCVHYERFAKSLSVTMRQHHVAGEKVFVDFSGDGLRIVDRVTGEERMAKLFVAVLGASSYTYIEPVLSEDLATWTGCHVRAFEYFGGVPKVVVPDNLRSGVKRPDRYDPETNPTYAELARHYGIAVIPARVRRPRDKAKVEQGVLLAERWILAALRNRQFGSLEEVRQAIAPLLEQLNAKKMQKLEQSRRELFEELDRPALGPLPEKPFELATWARPRVNVDYHVEFEKHYYSVPYRLVGKVVDVRATAQWVEILFAGQRVASHRRSRLARQATTLAEHMASSHRAYAEWTPKRLRDWAQSIGPATAKLVEEIMARRAHPEQGFRACLGVLRLRDRYPDERIERACERALAFRAISYKSVEAILRNQLDLGQVLPTPPSSTLPPHRNIRGAGYYH